MIAGGFAANNLNFQLVSGGWMLTSCLVWLCSKLCFWTVERVGIKYLPWCLWRLKSTEYLQPKFPTCVQNQHLQDYLREGTSTFRNAQKTTDFHKCFQKMCSKIKIYIHLPDSVSQPSGKYSTKKKKQRILQRGTTTSSQLRGQWRLALEFLSEAKKPYGVMMVQKWRKPSWTSNSCHIRVGQRGWGLVCCLSNLIFFMDTLQGTITYPPKAWHFEEMIFRTSLSVGYVSIPWRVVLDPPSKKL